MLLVKAKEYVGPMTRGSRMGYLTCYENTSRILTPFQCSSICRVLHRSRPSLHMFEFRPDYIAIGGNRHPAAADWDTESGFVAFGADQNIALWQPLVL